MILQESSFEGLDIAPTSLHNCCLPSWVSYSLDLWFFVPCFQVGKLQLAVSTVEQAVDAMQSSDRFSEQHAALSRLQIEQQDLKNSFSAQSTAYTEWKEEVAQQVAITEEGAQCVQRALDDLQKGAEQHPEQWRQEILSSIAPLQVELQQLQAQLTSSSKALTAALDKQPSQWTADMQATLKPLLQQLSQQEDAVQAACAEAKAIVVQVGSLESTLNAVQESVADHPLQWTTAVEMASNALRGQVAELAACHAAKSEELQVGCTKRAQQHMPCTLGTTLHTQHFLTAPQCLAGIAKEYCRIGGLSGLCPCSS